MTINKKANHEIFRVWAIILAGGAGSRMGALGQQIPKVFLPVGLDPVINMPVLQCEKCEIVEKIIVLTRKSQPALEEHGVKLEKWFQNWKELDTEKNPKLTKKPEIIYEEDCQPEPNEVLKGTVIGLYLLKNKINQDTNKPTHLLVVLGDNYIDFDFKPLLDASRAYPDSVIVATRQIREPEEAVNRYAVVSVDKRNVGKDGKSLIISEFIEKPKEPKFSNISLGLYCIPFDFLKETDKFIQKNLDKTELLGPPGYFLEYLKRDLKKTFRGVPFETEDGHFIDVGTPSSYLASIIQVTTDLLQNPKNVKELVALGSTEKLTDASYFLCKRIKVVHGTEGKSNQITLIFHHDDEVANSSKFEKIKADNLINDNNKKFWTKLERKKDFEINEKAFSPLLISGGAFLLDLGGETNENDLSNASVPLLLRDIDAQVDALRLTTPAGRMDKLDLEDVCFSEMAEEMIFFGGPDGGKILLCTDNRYFTSVRRIVIDRILKRKIKVPGIDPGLLKSSKLKNSIFKDITTEIIPPPKIEDRWDVTIELQENPDQPPKPVKIIKNMVFIPDNNAATLEFRLIIGAQLTSEHKGTSAEIDEDLSSIGMLRGIVDGDGHGRTAFLISLQALKDYYKSRNKYFKKGKVAFESDPHEGGLKVLAMTDASTGRFKPLKDDRVLSNACFTTTVSRIIEML